MSNRWRIALAEAIGTGVLVVGGCGTAIFAGGTIGGGPGVGAAGVATAFGLSLLIMAYCIGPISGCHINPAVTTAMLISGKLERGLAPFYIVSQFVGGLLGGLFIRGLLQTSSGAYSNGTSMASNGYGANSPNGFGLTAVILTEVALTAILVFVVLSTTNAKFPAGFGGVVVGMTLWLLHLISIPIDNTSVNPARSLGVAPWSRLSWPLEQVWVFIVFPILGGIIGAIAWRVLFTEPKAAAAFDAETETDVVVFDPQEAANTDAS